LTNTSTLGQLQSLLQEARGESDPPEQIHGASTNSSSYLQDGDRATAQSSDDLLALDDAENPLQLLARASDLRLTSPQTTGTSRARPTLQILLIYRVDPTVSPPSSRNIFSEQSARSEIHNFFHPMKASFDQSSNMDPIDIGLLTVEEADTLLS
jgi:hypothetical protein